MTTNAKTMHLFKTPVYRGRVALARSPVVERLITECYRFRDSDDRGIQWSRKNYHLGYTSYGSIDQIHQVSPYFAAVKKKIDSHVSQFLKVLPYAVSIKTVRMSSFWINIMGHQASHTSHLHPLSLISGTLYLRCHAGSPGLRFEDPRLSSMMAAPPLKLGLPKQNLQFVEIKARPGEILLFESWLRHEVPRNLSHSDRISVSFNYEWN